MGDAQTLQPTWDADRQSEMGTGSAKDTELFAPQGEALQGAAGLATRGCSILRGSLPGAAGSRLAGRAVGLTLTSEF